MKAPSQDNNFDYNMNDNYYLKNKNYYYEPRVFLNTLHCNQRSRSYNNDNREYHQPSLFNYPPHKKNNEDYFIFNRNTISHSTLPTKYFSTHPLTNEGGRQKFVKKSIINSIRFAPTTTTIDAANRLHSKPLNTNESYLSNTFLKNPPQWKGHQRGNSRFYQSNNFNKNKRCSSYDNIYSRYNNNNNNNNRPINLYSYSPRNLFRYIYIEPRNEDHKNHLSKHVEMSKVDYFNKNRLGKFHNNEDSTSNDNDQERCYYKDSVKKDVAKKNTKQYMVYFCCLSFKWPPWRIEQLPQNDGTSNYEVTGNNYNHIGRSKEKYNKNMTDMSSRNLVGKNYI